VQPNNAQDNALLILAGIVESEDAKRMQAIKQEFELD